MERLPDASRAGTLQALKAIHDDTMAVVLEESSAMEVDDENGKPKKRSQLPYLSLVPCVYVSFFAHCHLIVSK